jgi:hypothetical protein
MKNKSISRIVMAAIPGVVIFGTLLAPRVSAQCGLDGPKVRASIVQPSRQGQAQFKRASFLLVSDDEPDVDPIVGFWKVKFESDGTVIDAGYQQWHSDGTEILNSSKPPATSNFCLGVWKKTGRSKYKLNHFGISSDPNGNLIGPANIREEVVLDRNGNSYVGTFTIDQFDASAENRLKHIEGKVTATRVTVNTPAASLF